jgi:hypothetical protein
MSWIAVRQFRREIAPNFQSTCPSLAARLLLVAAAVTILFLASSPANAQTATNTTLSSSGSSGDYTLTGTVRASIPTAAPAPTGTVSFEDTTNGNAVLATAALVAGIPLLSWDLFPPIPATGMSGRAQAIAVGDFIGNGIPDLVVATAGSNGQQGDVSIFLGHGDGTFAPAINIPALVHNAGIVVGHFVAGGPLDVVSVDNVSSTNNVCLTITDGTGHLASQSFFSVPNLTGAIAVGPSSSSIALTTGPVPGGVVIFKSNGNGTFATTPTTVPLPFSPTGIVATRYGFAITNATNNSVTMVDGSTFQKATYPAGAGPTGIATGSFTSNGGADLIIANNGDDTVGVMLDNRNGTYSDPTFLAVEPGPYGVVVGDFNGDGKADFAVTSQTGNTVSIFTGNGDGTFSAPEIIAVGNGPQSIAAAPFTSGSNSGKIDLAIVNTTDGTISNLLSFSGPTATATAGNITVQGSGSHQVVAKYSGNANYAASQSSAVPLEALTAGTPLTLNPSSIPLGSSSLTLSLTSTVAATGSNPVGTVTFKIGTATLGSAPVIGGSATLSGVSPTTANGFIVGSNSITASYTPTPGSGFVASSGTQALTVTAPAYTISPSTTTVSLSKGGSQSVTVTLASTAFADNTSWTATASSALITVSPTSGTATLAANGSSTVTLTISASSSVANHAPRLPWTTGLIALAVLAGVPLAHWRKGGAAVVLMALAMSTLGVLVSCGGGGGPASPPNYTVTVSGTGGISTTIAVTVQ